MTENGHCSAAWKRTSERVTRTPESSFLMASVRASMAAVIFAVDHRQARSASE
jgi:hypothetical protein